MPTSRNNVLKESAFETAADWSVSHGRRFRANIIASEASSVTNCANLRFLVYIFIYLYICRRTSYLVPHAPPVTHNAQRANVGPAG